MQENSSFPKGLRELRSIRNESATLFYFVGLLSVFVNLLMLTGPIFMLQIYDRVLGSRSEETLVALAVLVVFLYALQGILDWVRARVMARVGARFQARLDERVFRAVIKQALQAGDRNQPSSELRDLEAIQRFYGSPVLFAIFDMPFTPLFAALIFVFHPILGWVALSGGAFLIVITVLNQWLTRKRQAESSMASAQASSFAADIRNDAEAVIGMGMQSAVSTRWQAFRDEALTTGVAASDRTGFFSILTKTFRLFLQSAMLGIGAYLVLQNEMTAGAMIAGSILLGRSLAPIEQALGSWPVVQMALAGWKSLTRILEFVPESKEKTDLPKPKAHLTVQGLAVVPAGEDRPALRGVSFEVRPGEAMGVIGQSASGKSTLARAITGIWPALAGRVNLDGASLEQYDPEVLGGYIGYLPQSVTLFKGTIAENIARLSINPNPEEVVAAAQLAGAHDMIKTLPKGYDTPISNDARLSGGQRQMIGLARALYGMPILLVLDEPNSNLDSVGTNALNAAIRGMKQRGGAVVIIAHRPAAIAECDTLLMLENGSQKAFGPRDEVLQSQVKNVSQIKPNISPVAKS
ncbi:MAG: type I secretion system permease/ATPase [Planktomarina sp.]|nr:type I secretion system permease/ATPase [Planktomarina sp.]MDE0783126.1 type I secretion system permease/ATPase [Planktomarina sp.]|tara:strand:+ start:678 stop:2414 length:1737 start_codon:yes stop_codon:yes gene_type:complete